MALVKVGVFTGNGVDARGITGIGFAPDFVLVKENSLNAFNFRYGLAGDDSWFGGGASGNTDRIQSLDADGFTTGLTAINADTKLNYYLAIKAEAADSKSGGYTGDGANDRNLAVVGFTPRFVLIGGSQFTSESWAYTDLHAADGSQAFAGGAATADRIQAIIANGFQVGTNVAVNLNLQPYYYLALLDQTNKIKVIGYTGNGTTLSVAGVGFRPQFILILKTSAGSDVGFKFKDETTTNSFTKGSVEGANGIDSFDANGFTVSGGFNTNLATYVALALSDGVVGGGKGRGNPNKGGGGSGPPPWANPGGNNPTNPPPTPPPVLNRANAKRYFIGRPWW